MAYMKCPECNISHRTKNTSFSCLCNAENSYGLDIIASVAGGGQVVLETPGAVERKSRLDKMESFYDGLRD